MERLSIDQCLDLLYNDIRNIRMKGKNNQDYDKLYVLFKSFFKLIDIDFPQGPYRLNNDKLNPKIITIISLFIDELVILLFYMDYSSLGLYLSDKYILDPSFTLNKNSVVSNQRFYTNKIKRIDNKSIRLIDLDPGWNALNPSIIKTLTGYTLTVRTVNYIVTPEGNFVVPNGGNIKYTQNYLLHTDKDLNILSTHKIIDNSVYKKYEGHTFIGLEDLILFEYNNKLSFTCTTLDTNEHRMPQISLCDLILDPNKNEYSVTTKVSFESPYRRVEKNWLPWIHDESLLLIYSYSPFEIKKYSNEVLTNYHKSEYPLDFSRFKGSAAPIKFDLDESGYLFIVHETFNLNQGLRCYLNRFIWMNLDLEIKKMSHPWYFDHHGVEFCRSMCHSHNQGEIILTYSIHDKDAQWCSLETGYIKSLLLFDLDVFKFID